MKTYRFPHIAALGLLIVLSGCGGLGDTLAKLNPFNSPAQNAATAETAEAAALDDGRVAFGPVTAARADRTPHGLILRAEGTADLAGFSSPILRARNFGRVNADGAMVFDLVANPPEQALVPGSEFARVLNAGTFISARRLQNGVSSMIVVGEGNQISVAVR